jgi:DNA-damage-inducible protein J
MSANVFVHARIDAALKKEAASVLADMGLTVSDLIRITLTRIVRVKALPFDLCLLNDLTAQTITRSDNGIDVHKSNDVDDLFHQLGIDDRTNLV